MRAGVAHEIQFLRGDAHNEDVGIEALASDCLGLVKRILIVADDQNIRRVEICGVVVDHKILRILQDILSTLLYCGLVGIDIEDLAHSVDDGHALLRKLLAGINQLKETHINHNLLLLVDALINLLADAKDLNGLPYRSKFLVLLHTRLRLRIVGEFLLKLKLFFAFALLLAQSFFVEDKADLFLEIQQPLLSGLHAKLLYEKALHILQLLVLNTAVLLGGEGK